VKPGEREELDRVATELAVALEVNEEDVVIAPPHVCLTTAQARKLLARHG
jgi:hypothetical protein